MLIARLSGDALRCLSPASLCINGVVKQSRRQQNKLRAPRPPWELFLNFVTTSSRTAASTADEMCRDILPAECLDCCFCDLFEMAQCRCVRLPTLFRMLLRRGKLITWGRKIKCMTYILHLLWLFHANFPLFSGYFQIFSFLIRHRWPVLPAVGCSAYKHASTAATLTWGGHLSYKLRKLDALFTRTYLHWQQLWP